MKTKIWRDPITLFALRFALIFGLLILPWPGWNDIYGNYFRGFSQLFFSGDEGKCAVVFSSYDGAPDSPALDTQITLANRDLLDSTGKGPMKRTELNTRSIGWVPTALTIALIVATPIRWGRRIRALAAGLILVHGFILFSLQAWIWNNSSDLSLLKISNFWKAVADDLDYTLINQMGPSFAVPVLIWIVVTFRSHDVIHRRPPQKSRLVGQSCAATDDKRGHYRTNNECQIFPWGLWSSRGSQVGVFHRDVLPFERRVVDVKPTGSGCAGTRQEVAWCDNQIDQISGLVFPESEVLPFNPFHGVNPPDSWDEAGGARSSRPTKRFRRKRGVKGQCTRTTDFERRRDAEVAKLKRSTRGIIGCDRRTDIELESYRDAFEQSKACVETRQRQAVWLGGRAKQGA